MKHIISPLSNWSRVVVSLCMVCLITIMMILPATAAASCGSSTAPSATNASTVVAKAFQDWKQAYVVDSGNNQLRVQRSANDNYDTVSEGIAYGMLFAVYSNDKSTFDGLWQYAQSHTNQNGVMNWRIAANGATTGYNGATDADEDMATALIAADTQWGGYKTDALKQIGLIKRYEVEPGSNALKPGDVWGGSDVLNPSYLTPSYYAVFAQYGGDSSWNDVSTASYRILNAIKSNSDSKTTGFIPDWSRADGYRANGMGYDYGYDGSRAPLRLAMAATWNCDASASDMLNTLNTTYQGMNLTTLVSSYALNGVATGSGDGTPLLAAAAAAATTSSNSAYRTSTWNSLTAVPSKGYFADSMRLFSMFVSSGILTNPLTLKSATPVTTTSTPVSLKSYAMTAANSSAMVGTSTNVSVAVSAPSSVQNALIDLEVYDANGSRVAQKFYDNQSVSTTPANYTVTFTPANTGTYTVRGGVFTANWASSLTWNNNIAAVSVAAVPVTTATATPATLPTTTTTQPTTASLPVTTASTPTTPTVSTTPAAPTPVVTTTPATDTTVSPSSPTTSSTGTTSSTQPAASTSATTTAPVQTTTTPQATTSVPANQSPTNLSIWWPGNGQTVRGVQPFKVVVDGVGLSTYTMYWQVDGGTLNTMADNYTDAPHKESLVDLSSWNWRANQTYTINFVAKNTAGDIITQKATVITVSH